VKSTALVFVAAAAVLLLGTSLEAQIPARGLTALVCLAGIEGEGVYDVGPSGKLVIEVSDDDGTSATVHIIHGEDESTHVLTYSDTNENGFLDCGDVVLTVT